MLEGAAGALVPGESAPGSLSVLGGPPSHVGLNHFSTLSWALQRRGGLASSPAVLCGQKAFLGCDCT